MDIGGILRPYCKDNSHDCSWAGFTECLTCFPLLKNKCLVIKLKLFKHFLTQFALL